MTEVPLTNADLELRAGALFRERFTDNAKRVDRIFAYLMAAQWLFAIVIAVEISPFTWEGKAHSIHLHIYLAVFLGGAISSLPIALALMRPGWRGTRYVIAVAQMLWSALLIHLTGGRIETHFHVFGSLAFLAFYRDWTVLVPATVVVAADHLVRQLFWPESVYGLSNPEWWRFLEHAGWVVFEDVILVVACLAGTQEMRQLARQQLATELHEREAAARMQTSILPSKIDVPGLEASAGMRTADLVGGDYYDVVPAGDGAWIGIGDVAGHGTRAGLTMMQAQSAFGALARHDPDAPPGKLWKSLNRVFVDNVRTRMGQDEHMTLSLIRYHRDGRCEVAGAHEEAVIWREQAQSCELLPITGTWIGLSERVTVPEDQSFQLERGDVLVLYTDGIIEAKDGKRGRVGIDRLRETVTQHHAGAASAIRDAVFALADGDRSDDASVVVLRYTG